MLQMSVLERQRAALERLYSHSKQQQLSSLPQQHLANLITGGVEGNYNSFNMFDTNNNCQQMAFSTVSNSSITTVSPPPEDLTTIIAPRENVVSTKKRKAEFSEEEDCEKSQRVTTGNDSKDNSKTSEVHKPDYIHVRARRGQATDSHSLAERARREKISKKMKYLQDLVPGCNKVTGKAGMLDEIINYVQSLQKQVEFLSMKLATLNPRLELNTDNFFTKDFPSYTFPPTVALPTLSEYNMIQHQQGSTADVAQRRDLMAFPDAYLGSSPLTVVQQQQPAFEPDLQSLFSVGFN